MRQKLWDEECFKDPTHNGVRHWVLILGLHGGTKAKERTGNVGDLFFNAIADNGFMGEKIRGSEIADSVIKNHFIAKKKQLKADFAKSFIPIISN